MHPVLGDPAADRYLGDLVRCASAVLGQRLIGAWLINSGARGDYLPARSDLDLTMGVTDELPSATKRSLVAAVRHAALPCPAPRLELVVYRREVLAEPGPNPSFEVNLETGPAIEDHVTFDPADDPAHWFVLDLSAARECSRSVVGPPLDDLLGPIPDTVVVEALRASAEWHGVHDADAPNRVLNACRAWRWLETGRWASKTQAGEWAIAAGGDVELIRSALARRRGETERRLPAARVAAFGARIDRLLAEPAGRDAPRRA